MKSLHFKVNRVKKIATEKMLTESEAVAIYEIKIQLKYRIMAEFSSPRNFSSLWGQTGPISKRYGVSSRTVKYIWNRQTWAHVTNHLWPDEPEIEYLKRSSRLPERIKCSSHSETSNQPEAWSVEPSLTPSPAANPCTTASSPFEPTTPSTDGLSEAIWETADSVSGTAAPWTPPIADRTSGGRPERLPQSADPPQIAKYAPCVCIPVESLLRRAFSEPSAPAAIPAAGPAPADPPPPWPDPAPLDAEKDPFHGDWPHW